MSYNTKKMNVSFVCVVGYLHSRMAFFFLDRSKMIRTISISIKLCFCVSFFLSKLLEIVILVEVVPQA